MRPIKPIIALFLTILLAACGHQAEPVKIHRFEQLIFDGNHSASSAGNFD